MIYNSPHFSCVSLFFDVELCLIWSNFYHNVRSATFLHCIYVVPPNIHYVYLHHFCILFLYLELSLHYSYWVLYPYYNNRCDLFKLYNVSHRLPCIKFIAISYPFYKSMFNSIYFLLSNKFLNSVNILFFLYTFL